MRTYQTIPPEFLEQTGNFLTTLGNRFVEFWMGILKYMIGIRFSLGIEISQKKKACKKQYLIIVMGLLYTLFLE